MDFHQKASDLITKVNNFDGSRESHALLISEICELFDRSMSENLSQSTVLLLYYLANLVGVPQYFDLLIKTKGLSDFRDFSNLLSFSTLTKEASMFIDKDTKVHVFQKNIIDGFVIGEKNRFIMSAPTSFGKTFIIYHLIEKMKYQNVVLIFPTISLLSENLQRIISLTEKGHLNEYKILTLSEEKICDTKNILIFTPERFMTFVDKNLDFNFEFFFMDEIYKIDNEFIIDNGESESLEENSRDIAFRIALEMGVLRTKDVLLAGPFLEYDESYTFGNFTKDNSFTAVNYNDIELVMKKRILYKDLKKSSFDNLDFSGKVGKSISEKIAIILRQVKEDETIVYCSMKYLAEDYALKIASESIFQVKTSDRFQKLISHLESNYTSEWCLVRCLKQGVGIHHGTIPKYIQREIIRLFNEGIIKCLFSTTTITEGVNTTARI